MTVVGLGVMMLAAASIAAPRPASACSQSPPTYDPVFAPATAARGAPTNARILVRWPNGLPTLCDDLSIWLRPAAGAAVELAFTQYSQAGEDLIIAIPSAPLAPETDYEILLPPRFFDYPCPSTAPELASTFRTGTGPDTAPPVFAGLANVNVFVDSCTGDCTCDYDWERVLAELHWTPAQDESAVFYDLYLQGEVEPVARHLTRPAMLRRLCWGTDIEGGGADMISSTGGTYSVRAVDLAGNEDGNTSSVAVELACERTEPPFDAGPPDAHPASPVDAGSAADGSGGGCGCDAGGSPPLVLLGFALLLLLRKGMMKRRLRGTGCRRRAGCRCMLANAIQKALRSATRIRYRSAKKVGGTQRARLLLTE